MTRKTSHVWRVCFHAYRYVQANVCCPIDPVSLGTREGVCTEALLWAPSPGLRPGLEATARPARRLPPWHKSSAWGRVLSSGQWPHWVWGDRLHCCTELGGIAPYTALYPAAFLGWPLLIPFTHPRPLCGNPAAIPRTRRDAEGLQECFSRGPTCP